MANGCNFMYMEDHSVELIHVCIGFKHVGAAHQSMEKMSVPALYAATLCCGVGKYSSSQFNALCSKLSISIDAVTTEDNLYIFMTVPSINREEAFKLLLEAIYYPKFEEREVKEIQQSMAYSLQDFTSNPVHTAYSVLIPAAVFKNHPYSRGNYGKTEEILKVSIKDLKEFRENYFTKNNIELCIWGDVSKRNATDLADKITSSLSRKTVQDNVREVSPQLTEGTTKYYADGSQTTIIFVMNSVPMLSKQRYACHLLYRILGENGSFMGRILSNLRSEKGLIYSGGVKLIDRLHSNYALGYLFVDNNKVFEAIDAMKKILDELCKNGISQEELDFAKENFKGSLAVDLRTSRLICGWFFGNAVKGLPVSFLNDLLKGIDAVTLEEINVLARNLLDKAKFIVIGKSK